MSRDGPARAVGPDPIVRIFRHPEKTAGQDTGPCAESYSWPI